MDARKRARLLRRLEEKIRRRVTDYHWKVASHLAQTYGEVYMGNMSTGSIIRNDRSIFRGQYKNKIGLIGHFQFKRRLQEKCLQYGTKYQEVHEGYTSKLCTNCGHSHPDLGSSKTYHCGACGYVVDRDVNGARNIYLKRDYQWDGTSSGRVTSVASDDLKIVGEGARHSK